MRSLSVGGGGVWLTTLKQTQSEKGRVTRTMAQETAVRTHPHSPMPSLLSSAEIKEIFINIYKLVCKRSLY